MRTRPPRRTRTSHCSAHPRPRCAGLIRTRDLSGLRQWQGWAALSVAISNKRRRRRSWSAERRARKRCGHRRTHRLRERGRARAQRRSQRGCSDQRGGRERRKRPRCIAAAKRTRAATNHPRRRRADEPRTHAALCGRFSAQGLRCDHVSKARRAASHGPLWVQLAALAAPQVASGRWGCERSCVQLRRRTRSATRNALSAERRQRPAHASRAELRSAARTALGGADAPVSGAHGLRADRRSG